MSGVTNVWCDPALTAHDSPRADKPPNLQIWWEGRWMTWWTTSPSSSSSILRSDPLSHGTFLLRCCPTTHTQTQVTQTIRHCAFALDNKFLLTATDDSRVIVWNIERAEGRGTKAAAAVAAAAEAAAEDS